jgi:hypothetical protein
MESDNPWRLAQTRSLREEAQKRGVELVVTDAQGRRPSRWPTSRTSSPGA